MATIDEDLAQLERDIRQLKIEYDAFFGGGRKRPPTEIEWRIDLMVKRYGERGGDMKYGSRFRFNNLAQTYAKYKDIFRKRLAQREEGKIQRHFGAAAKAIEAERTKSQPEPKKGAPAASVAERRHFAWCVRSRKRKRKRSTSFTRPFCKPNKMPAKKPGKLSKAGFKEFVRKKTKDLQEKRTAAMSNTSWKWWKAQVKLKALVKS